MDIRRSILLGSLLTLACGICPPPEAVFPCTCKENTLTCDSITQAQLQISFNGLKSSPQVGDIDSVHIKNYNSSYLPGGLFSGTKITALNINTSALLSFHNPSANQSAFSGAESIVRWMTFNYHSNPSTDFDWMSLSPLRALYNVFLSGSFVSIKSFPSLPTVVNFYVQNSDVRFIADGAFAGLTGMDELRLINNKMVTYARSMFPKPAPKLRIFITTGDNIKTLPDDYFEEMPGLQYVHLPSFVHNIPPLMTNGSVNLQGSRGLTCDCRLKWLLRMRDAGQVDILHAICARPKNLYWKDVTTLSEKDL